MAGPRAERPRRLGRGAPPGSTLHPDVLARYNFASGRGYDRTSVHEFRASALAVIDELLAERERGASLSGDHLSDDEQAMLAAFRLLDDERRADLLRTLFTFCAPAVPMMPAVAAQAIGTAFDVPAAADRRALGWPPPAPAIGPAPTTATATTATASAAATASAGATTTAGLLGQPSWRSATSWGRPASWPAPGVVPGRVIGAAHRGGPLAAG